MTERRKRLLKLGKFPQNRTLRLVLKLFRQLRRARFQITSLRFVGRAGENSIMHFGEIQFKINYFRIFYKNHYLREVQNRKRVRVVGEIC